MIVKSPRWQKTALAAAALLGLWGSNAMALSLGRITVQSALGEPLRAEIDIPDINADEAASLRASVALPDAFKAAGLEYSPIMAGLQVSIQRRTDGRTYIRLSSDRPVNDPFVDMILEASWASGRIVRDYTMLFDPPSLRQAAPATPTPAQVSSAPTPLPTPAPASTTPSSAVPARAAPRIQAAAAAGGTGTVTVKAGDTAGKIAMAAKPTNVSLDQMLVAMLRANPSAFAGDNINRVKAGSVINLPSAEQAAATTPREATQIIVAQSKDFNDYRRKLADGASKAQVAGAEREVSGSVQTKVEDKKPVTKAPDKLTLSKGSVQAKLAQDQLAKETASRAAEISKNISDLSKLGAASSSATSGPAASAAIPAKASSAPVTAVVEVAKQPASATIATSAVPAPAASTAITVAAAGSAAKPAASAPAKQVKSPPVAPPEPSLVDTLLENPLLPAGAIGLIALLAGLGVYRMRQRKSALPLDSVLQESHLQPESFFGSSGGQNVDTNDSAATGSAMVYSPSQLDEADDVDPVAEADVYLAYGRDLQAEEILKTALDATPERIAIHQKLLEILAKRQDVQGFENIATLAFKLTHGEGPEWARICDLGQTIDPGNRLYQPGGQPDSAEPAAPASTPLDYTSTVAENASALATQAITPQASSAVDLDLDLDFSLDEAPASKAAEGTGSTAGTTPSATVDLDFGPLTDTPPPEAPQAAAPAASLTDAIDFSLPDLEVARVDPQPDSTAASESLAAMGLDLEAAAEPAEVAETTAASKPDADMLEFDLGSLSLDLGSEAPKAEEVPPPSNGEDPLATKLALAEEFSAIGDNDGARALIEEVIAEASGEMKLKAQRALNNL